MLLLFSYWDNMICIKCKGNHFLQYEREAENRYKIIKCKKCGKAVISEGV